MAKKKVAHQPRIKGLHRIPQTGAFHPDTEVDIKALGEEFGVSRSWLIAFAVEEFLYRGKTRSRRTVDPFAFIRKQRRSAKVISIKKAG